MEFEINRKEYGKPKEGDIIILKNDNEPRMIAWIDGYYTLINLNTGENTVTYENLTLQELLDDLCNVQEIVPNDCFMLKRIK